LLALAGPYWNCDRRGRVRAATLLLFLLTVGQVGLTVWGNYWNRALFDALEARSVPGVLVQVGVFALILAVSIAVTAAHLMVKRWLQLDWRAWLTARLVDRWLADGRHYRLLFAAGEHDNPDARIAEDIRIVTESGIALAHTLVFSLMILGLFIGILWSVSGGITVPGMELRVPGYMVPLAFLYAGAGGALGWLLGRPLVRSTDRLQSSEASFRFGLSRAREHSEAIALMHGEPMERRGSAHRFGRIVHDWDRQSLAYLGIVSFATAYGALLPVFPIMVAAPQYIAGVMSLGVLMQAAQAFQRVTSALSWPVDNLSEIARTRASAERVLALHRDLEQLDDALRDAGPSRIEVARSPQAQLVIEDLTVLDADDHPLIASLSATVHRGERVLVTGDPAATGGLLKVIGGLWVRGHGRVLLPADGNAQFMLQRPYLPEGTLRAALCYPRSPESFEARWIDHALECTGLAWLAPRLDREENWEQSLPLRTQQRLAFARALIHQPAWVFMEGATDAFDPRGERLILEMFYRELRDAAVLAISFHPGLEGLHTRTLRLPRPATGAVAVPAPSGAIS
jgi:putative ATP-binding cassette transporter